MGISRKVLILNQHINNSLGGSELQCDLIARNLHNLGHEVIYLAINGELAITEYPYQYLPVEDNYASWINKISKISPDIVYWRYDLNQFYKFSKELKKLKIPLIFSVSHINNITTQELFKKLVTTPFKLKSKLRILRSIVNITYNLKGFKFISAMVVNNPDFLKTSKFNGVIKLIFNSNYTSTKEYEHTKDYILWVANLKSDKRPELVIELAKKIENKTIDILVVGDIQEKKYSYFKDSSNLPKNLQYLGKRTPKEVDQMVNNSLFVIHTCLPEGFPGIFIQAWLHGKGVLSLSFDPGGIIETNKLGFSANGSFPLFLRAVNHWLENNTDREEVKSIASTYAQSNFAPLRNAKILEKLIYEMSKIEAY